MFLFFYIQILIHPEFIVHMAWKKKAQLYLLLDKLPVLVLFLGSNQFYSLYCLSYCQYHVILIIVPSEWVLLSGQAHPFTVVCFFKVSWHFFYMNLLVFLDGRMPLFHLLPEGIFAKYRILGWQFFPFSLDKYCFSSFYALCFLRNYGA